MSARFIIPFGEGEGEEKSLPVLIKRLAPRDLAPSDDRGPVVVRDAWRVGHLQKLQKDDWRAWRDHLKRASRMAHTAAVLLVLDGDRPGAVGTPGMCPGAVAQQMIVAAAETGAGVTFSLAVVIALREVESWFVAGAESLKGPDIDGRPGLEPTAQIPGGNLELSLRNAKGWLNYNIHHGVGVATWSPVSRAR